MVERRYGLLKFLRFLLLALVVLLVGCRESVEKNLVKAEEVAVPEVINSEADAISQIDNANEEIELLDRCYENEVYIKEEETCALVINCTDAHSCIVWGNSIVAELEKTYGSLVLEESVATGDKGITVLTTYDVDNEDEAIYTNADIPKEEMDYHANLWFSFSWLIPEKNREDINRFEVFKSGDTLAYISLHDRYGKYWTLGMNNKNIELASETLVTYLHEYAHFLSLNQTQIDYWADEERCKSLYLADSGCFYKDAYLTNFYKQFWESGGYGELDDFYVSTYAMSSPEEDFAESFAHFILTQLPNGDTLKEQKLLFFYQYDELIKLRTEILSRTATWLERSEVEKKEL